MNLGSRDFINFGLLGVASVACLIGGTLIAPSSVQNGSNTSVTGPTGSSSFGPRGSTGPTGLTGGDRIGFTGPSGETGIQGDEGPNGSSINSHTGPSGPTGSEGFGPRGPQGPPSQMVPSQFLRTTSLFEIVVDDTQVIAVSLDGEFGSFPDGSSFNPFFYSFYARFEWQAVTAFSGLTGQLSIRLPFSLSNRKIEFPIGIVMSRRSLIAAGRQVVATIKTTGPANQVSLYYITDSAADVIVNLSDFIDLNGDLMACSVQINGSLPFL